LPPFLLTLHLMKVFDLYELKIAALLSLPTWPLVMWMQAHGLIPDGGQVFAVTALVIVDTVTGIAAAVRRKERVNSKRLSHIVVKMLVYLGLIEVSLLVTMAVPDGSVKDWIQGLVFTSLALTEGVSILENASALWPNIGPLQWLARLLRVKRDDFFDDGAINDSNKPVS